MDFPWSNQLLANWGYPWFFLNPPKSLSDFPHKILTTTFINHEFFHLIYHIKLSSLINHPILLWYSIFPVYIYIIYIIIYTYPTLIYSSHIYIYIITHKSSHSHIAMSFLMNHMTFPLKSWFSHGFRVVFPWFQGTDMALVTCLALAVQKFGCPEGACHGGAVDL